MAFQMKCPHCVKMLKFTENAFGKTLPCPGCRNPVTIPKQPEMCSPQAASQRVPLGASREGEVPQRPVNPEGTTEAVARPSAATPTVRLPPGMPPLPPSSASPAVGIVESSSTSPPTFLGLLSVFSVILAIVLASSFLGTLVGGKAVSRSLGSLSRSVTHREQDTKPNHQPSLLKTAPERDDLPQNRKTGSTRPRDLGATIRSEIGTKSRVAQSPQLGRRHLRPVPFLCKTWSFARVKGPVRITPVYADIERSQITFTLELKASESGTTLLWPYENRRGRSQFDSTWESLYVVDNNGRKSYMTSYKIDDETATQFNGTDPIMMLELSPNQTAHLSLTFSMPIEGVSFVTIHSPRLDGWQSEYALKMIRLVDDASSEEGR